MKKTASALTARQERFVAEYLVDGNGTRAAIAAGYGRAGARIAACRTLKNVYVQEALQARQSADATRLSTQRENVIQGLLEAIQAAKAKRDPAAMISGWREIGRMLGFCAPDTRRVQVLSGSGADEELRRYNRMSNAELEAIVSEA